MKNSLPALTFASITALMAVPVGAQVPVAMTGAQPAAPAPAPSERPVRVGAVLFGGIGLSKFNNVDKGRQALEARYPTAGFTSVDGSQTDLGGIGHVGGGVTFGFGQSPIGVSATVRGGNDTGPAMSVRATRTSPATAANVTSEYDPFLFFGVSLGVPIGLGRAVLIEPMLDLTRWKTTNSTFENVNGVSSTTAVKRSGSDPGFGLRAAWFPTRMLGFGYDLHILEFHDAAPGVASAPWPPSLENTQSFFSVYLRSRR